MAVLSEHAMDGYLQMPARGGNETMPDADVQAATEYMMLLTYPDRPGD
jgi:cytochrome c5